MDMRVNGQIVHNNVNNNNNENNANININNIEDV
jgi:hypothetical protein